MGSAMQMLNSGNQYRVAKANYEFNTKTQRANNAAQAAGAALQNFQITEGNRRNMEAAGIQYNDAMENINRALSKTTSGNLNVQLQAANAKGQLQAQAAAAGIGGTSIDLMDDLTDLQEQSILQENKDTAKSMAYSAGKQAGQVIDNAVQSFNNSQAFGNFNYTTYAKPVEQKNKLGTLIAGAVATYYGGPQAGAAVIDTVQGFNNSANGNDQAANANFNSAFMNGMSATDNWMKRRTPDGNGGSKGIPWFQFVFSKGGGS